MLVILLIGVVFSAVSDELSLNNGALTISVEMVDQDNIKFLLKVDTGDWVGIGFGADMNDKDMFYVSGGNFHDAFSTSESTPGDDADQSDYIFTDLGADGYEISRVIAASDSTDGEIVIGSGIQMSWARGSGGIANHGSNVGTWAFKLKKDLSVEITEGSAGILDGKGGATNWY